jgi:glycosyltransferase involved in cell wall biosynthesis
MEISNNQKNIRSIETKLIFTNVAFAQKTNTIIMINPKVSILITVYNLSAYIRMTIDSAINQDYDNIEIVISDDASSDDSAAIIQEYQNKYPEKIKAVFNKENIGITCNSNVALKHSTGDLIAMLDGDDIYLPGKISLQVKEFLNDETVTLCYHAGEIFDSLTDTTMYITNQKLSEDTNSAEEIIMKGGIPITSSVMLRRSAIPNSGFNEKLPSVNDWWLFIEVALQGKVVKMNGIYSRYRKHGKGVSEKSLQLLKESLMTLDLIIENHPEMTHLPEICNKGKARYIAGESYRQMSKDINISRELILQSCELDRQNNRYKIMRIFMMMPFASLLGNLLNKYKYYLKKI